MEYDPKEKNRIAGYEYNTLMSLMHVSVSKHLLDEHFTLVWASRISLRSSSNAMPDAAMSPIPPSCATAAAKRAVDSLIAIPPCMIGTSAVKSPILSTGSFNKYPPFQDYCNCQGKLLRAFP